MFMKKSKRHRKRTCLHCKEKFTPNRFNHHHQKYCGRPECQKASHRASNKRYSSRKRTDPDFRCKEVERVKKWRLDNPNYRNKEKKSKKMKNAALLRDFAGAENDVKDDVLRDMVIFQSYCIQGLVSHLNGALRDDIGSVMNRYYDIGKALCPELENRIKQGEVCHDEQRNHQSGPPETAAGRVRVGRSPPGT
jgi:hypothetical protein